MKWVRCTRDSKPSTLTARGRSFNIDGAKAGVVARVTDTRAQAMVNSGRWEFIDNRTGRQAAAQQ